MFKQEFKYYKSKKPPPNTKLVLDFNCEECLPQKMIVVESLLQISEEFKYTMMPLKNWCVFELEQNPGLIFIRNPFTPIGQRYWITRCLKDYTRKPNKLNIDNHRFITEEQNWWEHCQDLQDDKFTEKLRWATIGYHHNWDTKVYNENERSNFPKDLAELCSFIAECLNLGSFTAEAAIVNFYHMDSSLSGHTDHSEKNLNAPLFSFSFGQSAIFLIGGRSIENKPTALFLHSGDIIIMTKESRLSYHGVPKITPAKSDKAWLISPSNCTNINTSKMLNYEILETSFLWKPFEAYVKKSRVNVNVRQVND